MFKRAEIKPKWCFKTDDIVRSVAISSDGSYVVAGDLSGKVYLFDRNGNLLWSYKTAGDIVWSVAISSDGRYTVACDGGEVYFFDQNGKLLCNYDTCDKVWSVAISSDGRYVVASTEGEVGEYKNEKWDIPPKVFFFDRNGNPLWCYELTDFSTLVAITPDGRYVVAGSSWNVYLFDRNGNIIWSYDPGDTIEPVAI